MLIVLCQCNDISLGRNLEATTAAHLHIRTLKLANKCRVTLEHGNVKPVAVTVADKNVACITDVNSVWIVGEVLTTDTAQKLSFLAEDDDTMALHQYRHNQNAYTLRYLMPSRHKLQ